MDYHGLHGSFKRYAIPNREHEAEFAPVDLKFVKIKINFLSSTSFGSLQKQKQGGKRRKKEKIRLLRESCLGLKTDGKTDPGVKDSDLGSTLAREKDFFRMSELSRNYFPPRFSFVLQLWNSRVILRLFGRKKKLHVP